jgi:hypothetical protein
MRSRVCNVIIASLRLQLCSQAMVARQRVARQDKEAPACVLCLLLFALVPVAWMPRPWLPVLRPYQLTGPWQPLSLAGWLQDSLPQST